MPEDENAQDPSAAAQAMLPRNGLKPGSQRARRRSDPPLVCSDKAFLSASLESRGKRGDGNDHRAQPIDRQTGAVHAPSGRRYGVLYGGVLRTPSTNGWSSLVNSIGNTNFVAGPASRGFRGPP